MVPIKPFIDSIVETLAKGPFLPNFFVGLSASGGSPSLNLSKN